MALDPAISLQVRPPQFNVQVPNPLEQFGQVLSLGNLMQQRQLFPLELQSKQLGLEQQRLAYQQDLNLMNAITHPELTTTQTAPMLTPAPAAPVTPGGLVIGQGQGGAAIHSPDSGVSWVNSTTGTPYTGPRYGETPIGAGPAGVPYDPSAATVQPMLPPVSTPAPASATAPAPATPPVTTPPAEAPAAPPVPSGGIPGMPSWGYLLQVGGARAFPFIKNMNEAYTAQLTMEAKQLENAQLRNKEATSILNGMVDNESKNRNLVTLGQKGYLTWPEVRQYRDMDFTDPRFQARKESASQQSLTYAESVKMGMDRNEEARKQNKEVRDWTDYWDKQHLEQERQLREKVNAMSDPTQFGAMLDTDHLRNLYGSLIGKSLNEIKVGTGAGKPGETVPYPTAVAEQRVTQAGATAGAEATARNAAEDARYRALAEQVKKDPGLWPNLNTDQQNRIAPLLPQQFPYTTKLETGEASTLYGMQKNLNAISKVNQDFADGKYDWITGPFLGAAVKDSRYIPHISAEAKALNTTLLALRASLGDLVKGGVLRESDLDTYAKMFPDQTDTTENIKAKLGALTNRLQGDLDTYKGILRSQRRLLPGETPGAVPGGPAAAPAPAGPSYQTIEKTGAPGPRVTGTITIGGGAPAAPPGKIVVVRPASLGGGQFYLDSNLWPEYQKRGFTRGE